jgi:hypothetical protein
MSPQSIIKALYMPEYPSADQGLQFLHQCKAPTLATDFDDGFFSLQDSYVSVLDHNRQASWVIEKEFSLRSENQNQI